MPPADVLQEALKQLQGKLDQEAGTLVSSGRSDVLLQLKGQHLLALPSVRREGLINDLVLDQWCRRTTDSESVTYLIWISCSRRESDITDDVRGQDMMSSLHIISRMIDVMIDVMNFRSQI